MDKSQILEERSILPLEMILIIICNHNISRVFSHDVLGILPGIKLLSVEIL